MKSEGSIGIRIKPCKGGLRAQSAKVLNRFMGCWVPVNPIHSYGRKGNLISLENTPLLAKLFLAVNLCMNILMPNCYKEWKQAEIPSREASLKPVWQQWCYYLCVYDAFGNLLLEANNMTIAFRHLFLPLPPTRHKQHGRALEAFFYSPLSQSQTRQGRGITVSQCLFKNKNSATGGCRLCQKSLRGDASPLPQRGIFPFKNGLPKQLSCPVHLGLLSPFSVMETWSGSHLQLVSAKMHILSKGIWMAGIDSGTTGTFNCFISEAGFLTSLTNLSESHLRSYRAASLERGDSDRAPAFAEGLAVSPWYLQLGGCRTNRVFLDQAIWRKVWLRG